MSKIKIKDKTIEYTYIYKDVKYLRYELTGNKLHLIIPNSCKESIEKYILEKEDWIYRKVIEYEYPSHKLYDDDYNSGIYKIKDKELKFAVEYKTVKYIHYKLYEDRLLLILPKKYKKTPFDAIKLKEKWLYKKLLKNEEYANRLDDETKNLSLSNRTQNQLRLLCGKFVERYSKQLNVKPNRLQYRDMTRKW